MHLEDCPGFLIGKRSETEGTIRVGSTALAALGQLSTPFCCVVIRKAFGVAGAANNKPGATSLRMSWPSGDWGSLPIEGGIEVAYKAELAESTDPEAHLARIKERLNKLRSPYRSAEYFEIRRHHSTPGNTGSPVPLGTARQAQPDARWLPTQLPPLAGGRREDQQSCLEA